MKLKGRTAFVTGGNRGIGFELCRSLGHEGARVFLASRNWEKGIAAARTLQHEDIDISVVHLDVSDSKSIQQLKREFRDHIDILINNAAILDEDNDILELDEALFEQVLRTNLVGPVLLARHFAEYMKERRWGRIVNISSGMGSITRGFGSDSIGYRISKLALNGLTVALADSLRGTGVLVNSVDPGWVKTDMGGPSAHRDPEEAAKSVLWAVLIPDNGPSGGFFRDGKRIDF